MSSAEEEAIAVWLQKFEENIELKLQKRRLNDQECSYLGMALREKVAVQSLKLRSDGMGVIGLTAIGEALRENTSLVELELHGNNGVGDEGAEIIAEAVKENGRLRSLHLCSFGIGREGAVAVAAILRFSQSLLALDLEKNNIRADGVLALSDILKVNSALIELNIINNNIGDVGAEHIADCLRLNKGLKVLYLQQNNIGDEGVSHIAEALKVNGTMTTLGLSNNNSISPDGNLVMAKALKDNSSIAWLSGIDLSSFAQSIYALSNKQMDKIDLGSDVNNVQLLEQAEITREMTRIRYGNLTAKYKKDSYSSKIARRNNNHGLAAGGSIKSSRNGGGKRLLSNSLMSSIDSNIKSKSRK